MKRVHELFFEKSQKEVYIQAIGAAVQQAVDLALQV
jgi:DNA-binding protein